MAKLKVGAIGVGGILRTHMPGWQASEHAEVVAASDIMEEPLKKFGAEFNIPKLSTKAEDIINDPDIHIIDICTPNNYHAPLAIAAMKAGKHVICEKPLAGTPKEIREMIAARDASKKMLMTAQHFRFRNISKAMKAEINRGALGDVYYARSWMLRRALVPVRPGFIMKKHSGGGPCIDIGVHILDLTLWFMGMPDPVSVTGVARAGLAKLPGAFSQWGNAVIPPEYDVEDYAVAFVRFANGANLVLEVSWMLHHDTEGDDMQMWLYGTKGGSQWPKCEFMHSNNAEKQLYNRTLKGVKEGMEPHALECVEFAQAIVDGAPSPVPAEDSLKVMSILDGIYRSEKEGKEVSLK